MTQSTFYLYHTLAILFIWTPAYNFIVCFRVHASEQPEESLPAQLLDQGYIPHKGRLNKLYDPVITFHGFTIKSKRVKKIVSKV